MLAKRTVKNQITIPKLLLKDLRDIEYFDVSREGNTIVMRPVQIVDSSGRLDAVRRKIEKLGITEKDIEDAIRWVRRKS